MGNYNLDEHGDEKLSLEEAHRRLFGKYSQNANQRERKGGADGFTLFSLYRPAKLVYSSSLEQ